MPKKKARHQRISKATRRLSRKRWRVSAIIGLILCLVVVGVLLAQWKASKAVITATALLPKPAPTPSSLSPNNPAKEYIYAGSRLIAIKEPTATQTPVPPPLVNLALNRTTTQSSEYPDPGYTSDRAVNGQTSSSDLTHTQSQAQPWWQVDMGSVHFIDTVKLWNRVDCCQERLSNFYIFVSDTPFASTNLTATLNQAGVSSYYTAGAVGASMTQNVNRSGRYVRVQLTGTNFLSLAEVQVFGLANLAMNGAASQSSEYPDPGYTADKAINGSYADVTHTQYESQPWWQVDLGSVQSLITIKLWNRVDCCQERLSNFYVFVSDSPFQSTNLTQTQNQAGVASYYTAGQAGTSITISMNPNQTGRYVRIQLAGSNFLSLTEVQIWGTAARTNFALSANGGVASASSQYNANFPVTAAINGDRFNYYQPDNRFNNWHSGAGAPKPDWLQVDFQGSKSIDEIDVVTLQDNYTNPINPTEATSFQSYGLKNYEVQYWNGASWVTVTGGSVVDNNKVWRKFTFSPVMTNKVRVLISTTGDGYSRVMEFEAWGTNQ